MKDKVLTRFGERVRQCREAAGLSQEGLAERADLDRTYLSGIERGLRNPGVKNVVAIAKALRISVGDLFSH